MADINKVRAIVNAVSPMSVDAAVKLITSGRNALNMAIQIADAQELPGATTRANELQAMDNMESLVRLSADDPIDAQTAEQVRTTAVNGFVELNAVAEGENADQANSLFDAFVESAQELPQTLGKAAGATAGALAGGTGTFLGAFLEGVFTNHPFLLFAAGAAIYIAVKRS